MIVGRVRDLGSVDKNKGGMMVVGRKGEEVGERLYSGREIETGKIRLIIYRVKIKKLNNNNKIQRLHSQSSLIVTCCCGDRF